MSLRRKHFEEALTESCFTNSSEEDIRRCEEFVQVGHCLSISRVAAFLIALPMQNLPKLGLNFGFTEGNGNDPGAGES